MRDRILTIDNELKKKNKQKTITSGGSVQQEPETPMRPRQIALCFSDLSLIRPRSIKVKSARVEKTMTEAPLTLKFMSMIRCRNVGHSVSDWGIPRCS